MDDELYKQNILERFRKPYHKRVLEYFDIQEGGVNPSCGDSLIFYLSFDRERKVKEVAYDGEGCAISQATADMLCGKVFDMGGDEILELERRDVDAMLGIVVGPARERCLMLPLDTLKSAIVKKHEEEKI